jgi:antitoxin component of MazEF toxin-antitoxin module
MLPNQVAQGLQVKIKIEIKITFDLSNGPSLRPRRQRAYTRRDRYAARLVMMAMT